MLHRINRPTMVLAWKDNHQSAIPIPAGKVVLDPWNFLPARQLASVTA